MEIRALRPDDDRTCFDSGDPDLDRFFARFAGQNQFVNHLGTTYVAVEKGLILGYVTVAPGQIEAVEIPPASIRRKLPRYPLPILRLARMAVARSFQKKGLGRELLRFAFELALRMAEAYGCMGVCVDAKPAALDFYTRFDFEPLVAVAGLPPTHPQPTPLFLHIATLKDALRP